MIAVSDLRVAYGSVEAVRGVSFSVAPGEVVAVLGPNGAGKTSTLQVLEGHRPATSGTVRILGHDPWAQRARVRPHVGIMLQEAGFLGALSVAETIDAWRRFGSNPMSRAAALSVADLAPQAAVRVDRLSGGQRRRLDLTLAVLHQPRVLFLDEPTTGLDPQARQHTWAVVTDLAANGTAVLLTTHYMEEAERLAGRVLVLQSGRLTVADDMARVVAGSTGTISFRAELDVDHDALAVALRSQGPDEVEVRMEIIAGRVVLHTAHLDDTAAAVFAWAALRGRQLSEVAVRPASLEDVYLSLTAKETT